MDFLSGRYTLRKLGVLVDRLPRDSHLMQALASDDDLARQSTGGTGKPAPPPLSEWSMTVELLVAIFDRLGESIGVAIGVGGGKPPKLKPYPRPVTAADRARRAHARDAYERVMSLIRYEPSAPALPEAVQVPPKGGPGSSRDAWAAYAASRDVPHLPDATRRQIITACEAATT